MAIREKEKENSNVIKVLISCCDVVLMGICCWAVFHYLKFWNPITVQGVSIRMFFTLSLLCYIPANIILPPILLERVVRSERIISRALRVTLIQVLIFYAILAIIKDINFSRQLLIHFFIVFSIVLSVERIFLRSQIKRLRTRGRNIQHVIFIGGTEELAYLYNQMQERSYGYKVIGAFYDNEHHYPDTVQQLGSVSEAIELLKKRPDITSVFCALANVTRTQAIDIYHYCENNVIRFHALPMHLNHLRKRMIISHVGNTMMLSPRPEPLQDLGNRFIKRSFDILVSGLFLAIAFPLIYLIVAFVIKKQSPGPVFFKQKRSGLNGNEFYCFKFRSMHINKDSDRVQATENDPRKFGFGNLMRKTNIDELPQFINVFRGDMSLVGPRPHMLLHTEEYSRLINKYMVRHWVKPGITGWAQVQGFRGETKELHQMEERVRADIWYVENWSFWLDILIMWRTVWNMISHKEKNAY